MHLLVQLADGRKNSIHCLNLQSDTGIQAFETAVLEAVLPPPSTRHTPRSCGRDFNLSHGGRLLSSHFHRPSACLGDLGFRDNDLVLLVPSLRGGGGDGGSTCAESRSCYLEMYARKKPEKFDPKDAVLARWTNCLLTSEPLSPPCVVDKLGNILNKEAVLKALSTKSLPRALGHIRGLRDVMDVKLSEIPSVSEDALVRFQCPISSLDFNGNFKFFAMKCCGHVLSQRALKQLNAKAITTCPMCRKSIVSTEMLPINGTEDEVEELRTRIDEERAKAKADKAEKKKAATNGSSAVGVAAASSKAEAALGGKQEDNSDRSPPDAGRNRKGKTETKAVGGFMKARAAGAAAAAAAAASSEGKGKGVPSKVLEEGREIEKKRAGDKLGGQSKKYKAPDHAPQGASKDVYASIFLSSRKEEFKETYSCRSLPLGRN